MFTVKAFTFSPVQENTYILYNEQKKAFIIDPGCYFDEEREELASFLQQTELQPIQLLNTHCHLDHVFGNKWIYETYGLELHLHPNEKQVLDYAPASGLMWNLPFDNYNGPLHWLKESDEIIMGEDKLTVLFTPGHAPGHVCFYCKAQNFVIGGDVLFRESIGRTDLPGGHHQTLLNSIRTKLFLLPDETIVYSGHGPATTIGHEKKHNPFLT
ncbi:MAG TPA: MBL fold metallo-hydrolase [Lacibacter sp.]|jgi:glyoxylase-like metal-dependent hydrolase (beta-lactamase superfamily II)|nr:MBL fold metallo-hydrolase [Lacibacter sp.]